jgi:ferredoxin
VNPLLLGAAGARAGALLESGWYGKEGLAGMELEWILRPGQWAETHSILVCALSSFRPGPGDLSSPEDPHALIAPFAGYNHYAAAVRMMRGVVLRLAEDCGLPRRQFRIFCNSRMPEKAFMAASGLAAYGANGLAVLPGLGTCFVIAGVVIPIPARAFFPFSGNDPQVGGHGNEPSAGKPSVRAFTDPCGPCRACIDACPVGAIVERGLVDPSLCLQGLASRPGPFPEAAREAWGSRLYGCQTCQEVCPHNAELTEASKVTEGELGPGISLKRILSMEEGELKAFLRKTALGMSWISSEAILRNALIAAGNSDNPALSGVIARHRSSGAPFVQEAARWALEKCGSRSGRPGSVRL